MKNLHPIGVFDSGYGGLTVLAELQNKLPEYDFLYLGDNARAPYGTRSFETVYEFTLQAVTYLFEQNCELVILACNTASAKALRTIQQNDLPIKFPGKRVLGVIRPSAESVDTFTKSKHVGILATEGTVKSDSYRIEINKLFPEIVVTQHACPLWVPLIENNKYQTAGGKALILEDLTNLLEKDSKIDAIILGCTHYPIVQEFIQAHVPKSIQVISQGQIVADKLEDYLQRHSEIDSKLTKNGMSRYLTTDSASTFDEDASRILGKIVHSEHLKLI
ncbi:MAG: glutamate racemase [Crocinitomicaceae bacterium]|nr:glutamate racemase [Crocinitomicaceae bacterium]